ncbi:MAG: acyl-CoA dehydrogenase [Halobacteriovoraceae bacterium]|nr:acyl-CoA dehydrogenase [Halobacteriovoraceae bacterium]
MAQYKTDLQDVYFNLFRLLNAQEVNADYSEQDIKDIMSEFDKFVANEIYPTRQESDQVGVKWENTKVSVPECLVPVQRGFYENGWYGLGYPEEIGGIPVPRSVMVAADAMAVGANVSFSMYYGLTRGAMNVLMAVGNDAQKEKYIPKMMTGEYGGTMCLTEADAGSDVGNLSTTAEPLGNGKYKINGVKIFISSGDNNLYDNIIHLVLARTPGAPKGPKGLSLFIVPKLVINEDGTNGASNDVVCTKIEEKMGLHGQATCELAFGQNSDCIGELIGNELEGMQNMFIMMNEARLECGLQGDAQANLVYELTLQYAKERSQFQTELFKHPDVKRLLLRMRSMSRGLRSLNLYTASLFDASQKGDKDAHSELALLTPICKSYSSDYGFNVSVDAIQVHGGYGYCTEYAIEQFARDIKIASIYEGTNGIQAIDYVTRKILKDQGKTLMRLAGKIQKTLTDPNASSWPTEVALIGKSLEKAQSIVAKFAEHAQKNEFAPILEHATDFLNFSGHLVTAWLHLRSAIIAKGMIESTQGDEKLFLQSKLDDFRFFCRYYLVENAGISQKILNYNYSISDFNV